MSFTDHKITQFQHRVADLPDQPQIPAAELKSRFDACPEELRVAHNAVCDEAAALDSKVDGMLAQTFEGAIDQSMLSPELNDVITAKAEQSGLETEISTRASADSALSTRVSSLESAVPQKAQAYFGTYTGNGAASQFINLGFTPKAVLVFCGGYATYNDASQTRWYGGFALPGHPVTASSNRPVLTIESTGFRVYVESTQVFADYVVSNNTGESYYYLAFR